MKDSDILEQLAELTATTKRLEEKLDWLAGAEERAEKKALESAWASYQFGPM